MIGTRAFREPARWPLWLAGLIAVVPTSSLSADDRPPLEVVDLFEREVRPVLVETCQGCHGPSKQTSGLRLDSRAGALAGGEIAGPAIIPGDPDASPLLRALRYDDETRQMPPKGKLPERTIDAFATWIRHGAPWPDSTSTIAADAPGELSWKAHWAFQPIRERVPPVVRDPEWVSNPIDAFILAKLEAEGLRPSPPADRATWLRRVTFDVVGLPPTVSEIEAFLRDPDPDDRAAAKVVDRLLASPRYGERWGRHWLDVARYADTKGYVFDEGRKYPFAYTYRDYVVSRLNADFPYDRFLIEQIAADRLPDHDPSRLAAMGYLTVGRRFLNNQDDILDDRIDVVTRGLMGLTVACARCHDHKYDPIPTEDYYSLHGVFASSKEPAELPTIGPPHPGPDHDAYLQEAAKIAEAIAEFFRSKNREFRAMVRVKLGDYLAAAVELELREDHPRFDEVVKTSSLRPELLRGLIRRWSQFDTLRKRHPAFFAAWEAAQLCPAEEPQGEETLVLDALNAHWSASELGRTLAERPPSRFAEVVRCYGETLAAAESAARFGPPTPADQDRWESIAAILHDEESPWAFPEDSTSRLINRAERNTLRSLENQRPELDATHPGAPPRAMVLIDLEEPVEPRVRIRGNPGRLGKAVPRQFLGLFATDNAPRRPFTSGSGRLELAEAIAHPSNPLTARVLVNRLWAQHFGRGLVDTPSDFGLRSHPPSHPELLDYLATEFLRGGWSIKRIHRLILTSSTFRQQSLDRPECLTRDPENRWLWKFTRRRLEFEPTRDAILAVAGTLQERIGGRPEPLFERNGSTRRTLYGFIDRQNLDGVYRTFDFASPDASSPGRPVTTVPQQALFLLNSPFLQTQSDALARRIAAEFPDDPDERIRRLCLAVYGRPATDSEIRASRAFLEAPRADGHAPDPARVLRQYAQVLLLANEFVFID